MSDPADEYEAHQRRLDAQDSFGGLCGCELGVGACPKHSEVPDDDEPEEDAMADRYDEQAREVVRKLNGWQPSPFDPVDQELAVRDVAAALRVAAQEAQVRALDELESTSQLFDSDAHFRLQRRILKEGPL